MKRLIPLIVAVLAGAVCARLGVWQLDRLAQRRAQSAQVVARLAAPPLALPTGGWLAEPGEEDEALHYRRAVARGVFAFEDELIEMARTHRGSPGVHVLTPLRMSDGNAVLVNRGWAYSPDGRRVDRAQLAEPETTVVRGILVPPAGDRLAVRPDPTRYLPVILRRTEAPFGAPAGLVALDAPMPSDGPHLSYAIQWFAFGVIAVVGGVALWRRDRGAVDGGAPSA